MDPQISQQLPQVVREVVYQKSGPEPGIAVILELLP